MTTALAPRVPLEMGTLSDPAELGRMLAASGYFADVKDAAQAVVKVLAGRELGIPPIAAMTGVFIVKGRITLGANLIAALIKRHPHYDLRVIELSNERCEIAFLQDGEQLGSSEFTTKDAERAGLKGDNWRNYPRNMLFARAVSNGAKWFVPDVFAGGPIYTPDELGAETDPETGELLRVEDETVEFRGDAGTPAPEPAAEPAPPATLDVDGQTVDEATGEVVELRPPQAEPGETPEAPAQVAEGRPDTRPEPVPASAPADGDEPMNNQEFAKLIEYLDAVKAPQSFRQMAALAAGAEDLAQLTKGQARELMQKAKARYGK